jgi:hypothetical protein
MTDSSFSPMVALAITESCRLHDVTQERLLMPGMVSRQTARARQCAMAVIHKYLRYSSPDTGRLLKRDHATVLLGARRGYDTTAYWAVVRALEKAFPT